MSGSPDRFDAYLDFLEGGFDLARRDYKQVLVTPFTNPYGDCIEIRVWRNDQGKVALGDLGSAYNYLYIHGLDPLESHTTKPGTISGLLNSSQAEMRDGEVQIVTGSDETPGKAVLRLIQAVLSLQSLVTQ